MVGYYRDNDKQINLINNREKLANNLSEANIHRNVVENIIKMDTENDEKIEFLLQAVPDLGIIMAHLSMCKCQGIIDQKEYSYLSRSILLNLNRNQSNIPFSPLAFKNVKR